MSQPQGSPLAEVADRRWELIAVAVFLIALKSVASALMAVTDASWVRYLDWVEAATALGAMAIVLRLLFIKFARVPRAQRGRFLSMETYVGSAFKSAAFKSWGVTFVLLSMLATADRLLQKAPAEFFLNLVIAAMLLVFSLTFFILSRSTEDEEPAGA